MPAGFFRNEHLTEINNRDFFIEHKIKNEVLLNTLNKWLCRFMITGQIIGSYGT